MTTLVSTDTALIGALYHKPASAKRQPAQILTDTKLETRPWKIASDTFGSRHDYSERVFFILLALVAVVATFPCFSDFLRLVSSDDISPTVQLLLQ
jgi:ABC-type lipoprotein release transport system permease subunit